MERERERERDRDRDRGRERRGYSSEDGPVTRKRSVRFVIPADAKLDYKNLALLEKFITDSGKIVPRRITGVTGKQAREIETAIKRARYLGLLGPHSRS